MAPARLDIDTINTVNSRNTLAKELIATGCLRVASEHFLVKAEASQIEERGSVQVLTLRYASG